MEKLIVSGEEISVNNFWVERLRTGELVLNVKIPYASIEYPTLRDLFKNNEDEIKGIRENGTIETLNGFVYKAPYIICNGEEEEYHVQVTCLGEAHFQVGVLATKLEESNKTIEEQNAVIAAQKEDQALLEGVVLSMLMS